MIAWLWAAVQEQPWWAAVGAVLGVVGTIIYNRNQGAQVAIDGLTELTEALRSEIDRLRIRVLHLEGQLMATGLPITPTEEP